LHSGIGCEEYDEPPLRRVSEDSGVIRNSEVGVAPLPRLA
jgi:hypothetical protein